MAHRFVYNGIRLTPGTLYLIKDNYGITPIVCTKEGKSYEITGKEGCLGVEVTQINEIIYSTTSLYKLMEELESTVGSKAIKEFSVNPNKFKPGTKIYNPVLKLNAEISSITNNGDGTYDVSLKFKTIKDAETYVGCPIDKVTACKESDEPIVDEVWSKGVQFNYWNITN